MQLVHWLLSVAIVTPWASAQTTRLVPEQYSTIQSAIDACAANDTVSVAPGVYRERIDFVGKTIRVRSRQGPLQTVIQPPGGHGSVVRIPAGSSNRAALVGFTVLGLAGSIGSGIETSYSSPVIAGCIVAGHGMSWGAGISLQGEAPTVVSCLVHSNTSNSSASAVGCGWALTGGSLVNCTIVANHNSGQWGGIVENGGALVASNNIIRSNTAAPGGVWFNYQGTTPRFSNIESIYPLAPTNFDADPLFANPSQLDFRLTAGSPSIGAGSIDDLPLDTADLDDDGDTSERIPLDFDGYLRVAGGLVDQGAFEFHVPGVTYCTAKSNSLGCTPMIAASGLASASATSGFVVSTSQLLNNKPGVLLYGVHGPASTPFTGGTLCILPPIRRVPGFSSGGTAPPAVDCSGTAQVDMNAFARGLLGGSPDPALSQLGTIVFAQFWGRDPGFAAPNSTSLTDGLRYDVQP